jgi:hypothetical protein
MRKSTRTIAIAAALLAVLFALNCSNDDGDEQTPPEEGEIPLSTFEVDTSVTPYVSELPGFDDESRPIAALVDEDGVQAEFVENELLVMTDDSADLDPLLERWSGEVVLEIDPTESDIDYLPRYYLVRVDPDGADTDALPGLTRQLHEDRRNDLRVSSREGLQLLAAAATEAVDGLDVGLAWVGRPNDIIDRESIEAHDGDEGYGDRNAFNWPTHTIDSEPRIGTAEAWRLLTLADRLENKVGFAILDNGYFRDDGLPEDTDYKANPPFTDPFRKTLDKPQHGAKVARVAMELPDDESGSAGAAGPVARGILIYTSYDYATSVTALIMARRNGAKIANMSYGAKVPAVLGWTVRWFNVTTRRMRNNGMLLFAAAGNDNQNIEAKRCLGPFGKICWEKRWHTPCENNGVICVGGLQFGSAYKDPGSNFGGEHLDIWAPYSFWIGPNKDQPADDATYGSGTSYSSPYTAGIAALIWAAEPRLGAGDVVDILYETAHSSPDGDVERIVNAYDAVKRTIGNVPPYVEITSPGNGSTFSAGSESIPLEARIEDLEDDVDTISWGSSIDGQIGEGRTTSVSDLSVGTHEIFVRVVDAEEQIGEDRITVTITNDAPEVDITSPEGGAMPYQSQSISLRASTYDPNLLESVPDNNVQWYVDDDRPVAQGHSTSLPGGTLTVGAHTVRAVASDGELQSEDTVDIIVQQDPPDNVPPTAVIDSPDSGESFYADQHNDSVDKDYALVPVCGHGEDAEDGELQGEDVFWYYREKGTSVWQIIGEDTGPMSCPNAQLYLESPQGTDYELKMEVTDSDGATDDAVVEVFIDTLI